MRIGHHVSVAGSLEQAARHAHSIGANTLQIFTSSPRMWRASLPRRDDVVAFERARAALDLTPLAVHDNYLINLASADPGIRANSIQAYRGEVERALAVGADFLVAHPGSSKGLTLDQAILNFVEGLVQATRGLTSTKLWLLLENTAGQGAALGSRLEELATMRTLAAPYVDFEIGYCLDTAHLFAAGFDLREAAGMEATLDHAGQVLGLERVPLIHANDSKPGLGSRVDRHEHIGRGQIGAEAFGRLLRHETMQDKAFILETPIDEDGDDARNVARLRQLS